MNYRPRRNARMRWKRTVCIVSGAILFAIGIAEFSFAFWQTRSPHGYRPPAASVALP